MRVPRESLSRPRGSPLVKTHSRVCLFGASSSPTPKALRFILQFAFICMELRMAILTEAATFAKLLQKYLLVLFIKGFADEAADDKLFFSRVIMMRI